MTVYVGNFHSASLRMSRWCGGAGELLDGFANDLELANDGILPHPLGHESVAALRRVFFDVVADVTEVELRGGRANVIIRGLGGAEVKDVLSPVAKRFDSARQQRRALGVY